MKLLMVTNPRSIALFIILMGLSSSLRSQVSLYFPKVDAGLVYMNAWNPVKITSKECLEIVDLEAIKGQLDTVNGELFFLPQSKESQLRVVYYESGVQVVDTLLPQVRLIRASDVSFSFEPTDLHGVHLKPLVPQRIIARLPAWKYGHLKNSLEVEVLSLEVKLFAGELNMGSFSLQVESNGEIVKDINYQQFLDFYKQDGVEMSVSIIRVKSEFWPTSIEAPVSLKDPSIVNLQTHFMN